MKGGSEADGKKVLLIATPASSGTLTAEYADSLFRLQKFIGERRPDIELRLQIIGITLLDRARNVAASLVYGAREVTHLLFIDADQGFAPTLVVDMIDFNKGVVSAFVPKRRFDLNDLHRKARRYEDVEQFKSRAVQFVTPDIVHESDGTIRAIRGFVRVSRAGTGIMLIHRSVIERMAELPGLVAKKGGEAVPDIIPSDYVQCFRPICGKDNAPLSEDISFCVRWIEQCGGEIWANIMHEVTHVGQHAFKGKFVDTLT